MPKSAPAAYEDFASLLDAHEQARAHPDIGATPPRRVGPVYGLGSMDDLELATAAEARDRLYAEESTHAAPPLLACDSTAIAAELGLSPSLGARDLERIRRQFALANHPDRVDPAARALATARMTLANALIDQALRELKRKSAR